MPCVRTGRWSQLIPSTRLQSSERGKSTEALSPAPLGAPALLGGGARPAGVAAPRSATCRKPPAARCSPDTRVTPRRAPAMCVYGRACHPRPRAFSAAANMATDAALHVVPWSCSQEGAVGGAAALARGAAVMARVAFAVAEEPTPTPASRSPPSRRTQAPGHASLRAPFPKKTGFGHSRSRVSRAGARTRVPPKKTDSRALVESWSPGGLAPRSRFAGGAPEAPSLRPRRSSAATRASCATLSSGRAARASRSCSRPRARSAGSVRLQVASDA